MNFECKYKIGLKSSKFYGYQSKKGNKGVVKVFINNIYRDFPKFNSFVRELIYFTLIERICLERAFNKIRIKGGMCNPCCVRSLTNKIFKLINKREKEV